MPTDRFSHSTAFQFYQLVGNLTSLIRYVKHDICPQVNSDCSERAERLASAVSLDISFDAISHALRITAVRPLGVQKLHVRGTSQHRTEVGILGEDRPSNPKPDELGLSGLLTVLGQDSAPSPTVFTIPARHRDAGSGFSARFLEPTGLHPTLQLAMESNKAPTEKAYCALHAYMTLPRPVFPDKYQLADHVFMSSKNLTALRYSSDDVDLEAPDYVLKGWGSSLLVELAPPRTDKAQSWTVEVPLHARYLSPNLLGHQSVDIPYPAVFWACTAEEGTKFSSNPFERANLGYDALFGQRTAFWHVQPRPPGANDPLVNTLKIPVLDLTKAGWVEAGTAAAVMLGLAWVAWKLLAVHLSPMHRGELATSKSKKTK